MKAVFKAGSEPGHGELELSGSIFPDAPWSLSILRASDQNYLTGKKARPWVGEAFFMQLPGSATPEGALLFRLGPEVVDNLDPQEKYLLTLRGNGDDVRARLDGPRVIYSAEKNRGNVPTPEDVKKQAAAPMAPSAPEKTPEAPNGGEPEEPITMAAAPPAPPAKKNLFWKLGLICLLAAACLAWYLIEPARESANGAGQEKGPAENGAERQPAPSSGQGAISSVEEKVRQFFRGGQLTAKNAALLAGELSTKTPAEQDAVYRLLYYAAEHGEPSMLLPYGACMDPSKPQWGTIEKDAPAALAAYRKALATEPDAARQNIDHLTAWLGQQASNGNRLAQKWLAEIKNQK